MTNPYSEMSDREFADLCQHVQEKRLAFLHRLGIDTPVNIIDLLPDDMRAEAIRRHDKLNAKA